MLWVIALVVAAVAILLGGAAIALYLAWQHLPPAVRTSRWFAYFLWLIPLGPFVGMLSLGVAGVFWALGV